MKMELTVVITTFDRIDLLGLVLDDLQQQTAASARYEVVVVDNAGQSACQEITETCGFKYFHEKNIGHCHARNRGLKEAGAPWVLYFDDDVRLPVDILDRFLTFLPAVTGAAFGGAFHHWYLSPPPLWLKIELGVGRFPSGNGAFGVLPADEYLIGCFFAVDKMKVLSAGGFDPELGMKGKEVGWADETELQFRLRQQGHEVFYAPELIIQHLVQPWKCSLKGQLRHAYSLGKNKWIPQGGVAFGWGGLIGEFSRITFIVLPVTMARWFFSHWEWHWQNALLKVLPKYAFAIGRVNKQWEITTA